MRARRLPPRASSREHTCDVSTRRCSYCLASRPASAFGVQGDHVVPSSLGGAWVDHEVCRNCNAIANRVADELVSKDPLVRFLRMRYDIPDRYGKRPRPPIFPIKLDGGVVKALLHEHGPTFEAGMPPSVADRLVLANSHDQVRLREIVDEVLGTATSSAGSIGLARIAQKSATPPFAWSRFMAKLGLACGRAAYGDSWLDGRQARTLSRDLLSERPPRFSQRTHYPPVEQLWPFEPPKHQLWIQPADDTAVLMVVLFGQVLGAVPVNDLPAEAGPSAWSLDPRRRSWFPSNYPAIWLATAAARASRSGASPVLVAHPDHPVVFVPDGPAGPVDVGAPLERVASPAEAFNIAKRLHESRGQLRPLEEADPTM